jgi:transposase-like protein
MYCPSCRKVMLSTSSQEVQDGTGAMTVTRWRCSPCHETAEEIYLSAGYRGASPTRIRYAVADQYPRRMPIRSYGGNRGGATAYAVAP